MSARLNKKVVQLEKRLEQVEQFLFGGDEEPQETTTEEEGKGQEPVGELTEQVALQEKYGESVAELLYGAGFTGVEAVTSASDEELRDVDGIGAATLKKIREASDA